MRERLLYASAGPRVKLLGVECVVSTGTVRSLLEKAADGMASGTYEVLLDRAPLYSKAHHHASNLTRTVTIAADITQSQTCAEPYSADNSSITKR
jgi:hypothetical protein